MGSHTTSGGGVSFGEIPFGDTIAKISQIHQDIMVLRENENDSIEFEVKVSELEKYLVDAYKELADSANAKVENWKEGPIKRIKHIAEGELVL